MLCCCPAAFVGEQITLSSNNMWGIIHMIVELLMKHDDGKYVMMKVSPARIVTTNKLKCSVVTGVLL